MASTRFYQWTVVNDAGFLGAIEASCMKVAANVLGEAAGTPNAQIRKNAAMKFLRGLGSTRERVLRLMAWLAVFDPDIASVAFDIETKDIHPELVDDADLDALVLDHWTLVSTFEDMGAVA